MILLLGAACEYNEEHQYYIVENEFFYPQDTVDIAILFVSEHVITVIISCDDSSC